MADVKWLGVHWLGVAFAVGLATATFSFDLNVESYPLNVIGPQQQVAEVAHQRSREVGAAGNIIGKM